MYPSGVDDGIWRQHAWSNRVQSLLLLVLMGGFLALLGDLLWGGQGVGILLGMGAVGVLLSPAISPHWVMRLYGASPIEPDQAPALFGVVSQLAGRAGLPTTPQLYYLPSGTLNAFAVGTVTDSALAISDGLLRKLNLRELAGVLAHEISHVRNNDLLVMGLADTFSRATYLLSMLGQFLLLLNLPLILLSVVTIDWLAILLLIFAPSLSALAQLALSRTREYSADLNAARLTGDPDGLASALARIERVQGGWLERVLLPGRRVPAPSLLRTHPDTAERIARLQALRPDLGTLTGRAVAYPPHDVDAAFGNRVRRPPRWHFTGLWH